ncbi:hypothetical protein HK100_006396 [Physocladia obscura]|uniref:NmrA-like domain-containing protein n=1 Tax=Physocladia obscura TaxID=109957 RepID=A0AAD5T583_9FUNG|nr:hypothetical protein HK100_006396 [Physocladia obscura]
MSTSKKFLVTAAAGDTSSKTVSELLRNGHQVRALVRKLDDRSDKLKKQGAEVIVGDLLVLNDVKAALEGIHGAYFCFPLAPGIVTATAYFAQAAKENSVKIIVNMSQQPARYDAQSVASQNHFIAERLFDWSGVPTVHIRPGLFTEWYIYPGFIEGILESDVLRLHLGPYGKHAPIAVADLARFISALLEQPGSHHGKTYVLNGPVELDYYAIADALSKGLGRKITYQPMSPEDFRQFTELNGLHPYLAQHLTSLISDFKNGIFAGKDEIIAEVTGKPPMTVEEWAKENRDLLTKN